MTEWIEAFTIFTKHGTGNHDIYAEHDEIFVQCEKLDADSEDGKRVVELGWRADGEGGWKHFV